MPIAAAIPAIIGAAGAIGGGLLANRKSSQEKEALSAQSDLAKTESEAQKFGTSSAQQLLPQATASLGATERYYAPLLSGNRQSMLEAVAPEANTIISQYDTAKRAAAEFAPRGGGRTTTLAELPFSESGAITNLLNQVRPNAAGATADIGKTYGALASSLLSRNTGAASSLLNYSLASRGQSYGMAEQMGGSIGSLLYNYLKNLSSNSGTNFSIAGASSSEGDVPLAG
jgi:hypothetical protein